MKPLLTTLSVLTLATTGSLNNILHTTYHKNTIKVNSTKEIQQDTKYIDRYGKEVTTSKTDLSDIITKEITQIGFYPNKQGEVQAVKMPRIVEKVPNKLPHEITSLENMLTNAIVFNQDLSKWNVAKVTNMTFMFAGAYEFNQDISKWNTGNVTSMSGMFYNARKFNQNLSDWNVTNVTKYENFNEHSGFENDSDKLPKFKK